jgi:hypothetical protein
MSKGMAFCVSRPLLLALTVNAAHATDYDVAYGGGDSGSCADPAQPCSLGYALAQAGGPDVVIHPGPTPAGSVCLLQKAVAPDESLTMASAPSASACAVTTGSPTLE